MRHLEKDRALQRDGITYLTRKNEERWIWPSQFKNPEIDIQKNVFAVGDIGGNAIQVFTEDGVKGEIETTLPIEMFSVSDQGIVSAVLKNENAPMIVTYDAAGNILVEIRYRHPATAIRPRWRCRRTEPY